jgi:regulator of protease activity HflC (stomatin/prohibitin superfamily)
MNKKLIPVAVAGLIVGGIVLSNCTTVIKQGHVGAVYDRFEKGIQDYTLSEGLHFISPWQKVNQFPISVETVYMSADEREGSEQNESITVSCQDGSLNADLAFSYRFDSKDIPNVQRRYRGKDGGYIMNNVLRGQLRTWVSEVSKDYTTMEVHLTKKNEVNDKLTQYLNQKAEKYGVIFENVSLAETRATSEVQRAIEKRQQISQEVEQQKLELEKSEIAKEKAQLDAERKLIEAQGERKANEEKAKGLDSKILEQMKIEKWDGQLPVSTNGQSIIDFR